VSYEVFQRNVRRSGALSYETGELAMAQEWHYAKDGQRHGPITSHQLKELAGSGELRPTDLVWTDGQDEWKPAHSSPRCSSVFMCLPEPSRSLRVRKREI
jgi:hypothetical protein